MLKDTVYIKVGKKYKKIGHTFDINYQPDGIWLYQSYENSKEANNLSIRLQDLPPCGDIQKFAKAFLTKESIIKAINTLENKKDLKFYNVSRQDIAEEIIKEVYLNSIEKK